MFAFVFSIIIGNNYNYIIYFLVSFFSHFLLVSAHRCVYDFSVLLKFITTPTLDLNHHRFIPTAEHCFENRATATFFLLHRVRVNVFVLFKYKLCVIILALVFCLFILFNSFLYKAQFFTHSFFFLFLFSLSNDCTFNSVCVLNVLRFFSTFSSS